MCTSKSDECGTDYTLPGVTTNCNPPGAQDRGAIDDSNADCGPEDECSATNDPYGEPEEDDFDWDGGDGE